MSGVRRGCWEGWLQEVCKMIKIALTFEALTRVRSDMFCWQKVFKKKSPLKHNGDFIKTRGKIFTAVVYSDGTFHIISIVLAIVNGFLTLLCPMLSNISPNSGACISAP